MRYLIAFVLCALLAPIQALACRSGEYTLLFETIPNPPPDSDVIVKVTLLEESKLNNYQGIATAKVSQVLKSSDKRIHQDSIITMKYLVSSCGPYHLNGDEGAIIAKASTDSKGGLVLYPYMRRYHDGYITQPAILPDGFAISPKILRVGESIPQNFAVILIGIAGEESVDFINFDHSSQPRMIVSVMDARFPAALNTIVAIAIPVGIKQLSIFEITAGRQRLGYRPNDTVKVNTPKIDIDQPGLYYVATLDTDNPGQFQVTPLPEQLKQFHADYVGTVDGLKPINFQWPSLANPSINP